MQHRPELKPNVETTSVPKAQPSRPLMQERQNLSFLRGYKYVEISPKMMQVFLLCNCQECGETLRIGISSLTATKEDMIANKIEEAKLIEQGFAPAKIAYAGGPIFCPLHYRMWFNPKEFRHE